MAHFNPEASTRKRKESIDNLKRDQPLFASRPLAPSQQPPDFFTESLNTSYVPSPSPVRSPPKRQHGRPKSRQFPTAGRSLAAAFKAAPDINDENQRPISSSSSSDQRRAQYERKPLPSQSSARPQSSPAGPLGGDARVRTPSPARGRGQSLVSPASSYHSQSSPPRGLAEAYQRIVDEESLAQEESVDDMDAYGYDYNGEAEETDLSGLDGVSNTASPISLKASRKASREPTPVRHYSDNKENSLHHSESGSHRSSLENQTERSVDSAKSQYEKDSQRLNGALRSNVKIFSKARVGERVGLTVENLRRRNDSSESLGSAFGGSLSSRGSDPSLNLPRAWGRKAKPPKDWLSRINNKSGKLTGDVPTKQKADSPIIAESEKREWDEPIDEWIQAAADVPLPSEENGSSQVRSSSISNTSLAQNALRDNASGWDVDADFTGRSLQVSDSPPLRIRNASSDESRNREIDRLEKSAVATSRLGEIREKTSREMLGQITPQNGARTSTQDGRRSVSRSSWNSKREDLDPHNRIEDPLEGDGEPIPDTPVVVYRSTPDLKTASSSTDRHRDSAERPSQERQDSRDILQKLARATSASPVSLSEGPPTSINARSQPSLGNRGSSGAKEERSSSRKQSRPRSSNDGLQNEKSTSETVPKVKVEETPVPSKPKARLQTPQITGGWIDNTISEESSRPSMPNVTLKTPMVTGAWVDTPLPAGGRGPPMPTPNLEDDKDFILEGNEKRKLATFDLVKKLSPKSDTKLERLTTSRPLPKSALESVLNAAKASLASGHQPGQNPLIAHNSDSDEEEAEGPLHLGESTIQSLEDILADKNDINSFPSALSPSASDNENENEAAKKPDTRDIDDDLKPYTRQLSRLSSLLPSIRDARKNIASLERAVASSTSSSSHNRRALTGPRKDDSAESECTEAGEFHDFIWPCSKCGSSSAPRTPSLITLNIFQTQSSSTSPSITTVSLPLPILWHRRTPTSYLPRFTWLGMLVVLGTAWYIAESVTCNIYCHPQYAYAFDGFGVDINAPEPPFVFEKMVWRWLSLGKVWVLVRALGRLLSLLLGGGEGETGRGERQQPISTDPRIPRPDYAPDLSMYQDDYL